MNPKRPSEREPLNFGARAKRRSDSQRVGTAGELLFEQWCLHNGLVSNRCHQDFGIDYFCQALIRRSGGVEELRGETIGVQVRSVKGAARHRVVLDKTDAETALRLECPYLLVGVSAEESAIYFRFLDTAFADRLAAFISSSEENLTLRIDGDQFSQVNFASDLTQKCNPGVQHRLRLHCTELCIQRDIKGARLKVIHDATSGFAHISVPWVTSIFRAEPGHEGTLARVIFEEGPLPDPNVPGISLHPSLYKVIEVLGTDKLAVTGEIEEFGYGYVEREGKKERLKFRRRKVGNTHAYISECGLVITVSESMKLPNGSYGHELGIRLSREFGLTFDRFEEFDAALRLFKKGAKIAFSESMRGMDIGEWGPRLELLGHGYTQIVEVFSFAQLPLSLARLVDLTDIEFTAALATLWALARNLPAPRLLPRVLVGAAARDERYEGRLVACQFEIPIVMNVKSRGVAAWIRGTGRTYLDGDQNPLALMAEKIEEIKVDLYDERFKTASSAPEMWIFDWPPMPLSIYATNSEEVIEVPEADRERSLRGRIWTDTIAAPQ